MNIKYLGVSITILMIALLIVCCIMPSNLNNTGVAKKVRYDRDFSSYPMPLNEIEASELPRLKSTYVYSDDDNYIIKGDTTFMEFFYLEGGYGIKLIHDKSYFIQSNPVMVNVVSNQGKTEYYTPYTSVKIEDYGLLAVAKIVTESGTSMRIEDMYYIPKENVSDSYNLRRVVIVEERGNADVSFNTRIEIKGESNKEYEYFMPHKIYRDFNKNRSYRETTLGLPFVSVRQVEGDFALSLGRYQPVINPEGSYYGNIGVNASSDEKVSSVYVDYSGKQSFMLDHISQIVVDFSITGSLCSSFNEMMVTTINKHYLLQNQRIVNTDIEQVLKTILQDYQKFVLENETNGKSSYGLPWRITIENGKIGPRSYQAGFVGQQIPAAYQMIYDGLMNKDEISLNNGLNIINFWLSEGMMNDSGVPKIWYDGEHNRFNLYPTFLRMAVDAMEGLLDAYQLAEQHDMDFQEWYRAIVQFADFLVAIQNDDGSFYRCFNWSGQPFENGDDGIPEPGGNICQSYSKANSQMPVRFLGEVFELTGDERYKKAAIDAGQYVYENIYPSGVYIGGTCDNANVVDKEAGVYAMFCYDTMYMLTRDEKWIEPLKQSAAFSMSMVQGFSFPIKKEVSDLKAAYALMYGYNDGSSFITNNMIGMDNYAAIMYYELFKIYIITGEPIYLYQAEFIQQNTKSLMDWDGRLNYPYKSLVAEATNIADFNFASAKDDEGIQGVWLPWSSVANAAPIIDMILNFGSADVMDYSSEDIEDLRDIMFMNGCG